VGLNLQFQDFTTMKFPIPRHFIVFIFECCCVMFDTNPEAGLHEIHSARILYYFYQWILQKSLDFPEITGFSQILQTFPHRDIFPCDV
jgi:hypothetical protein